MLPEEKLRKCEPLKFSETPAKAPLVAAHTPVWWELQRLLSDCVEKRANAELGVAAGAGMISTKCEGKVAAYTFVIERLGRILEGPK